MEFNFNLPSPPVPVWASPPPMVFVAPSSTVLPAVLALPPVAIQSGNNSAVRKRTHLTNENKIVALIQLCVANQREYAQSNKGNFWAMISELLLQEVGVSLRDPSGTVKGMVLKRRTQVRMQIGESGTVQEDTELTQAADQWIEIEDRVAKQKIAILHNATAGVVDRQAEEAAVHRANFFCSAHKKRDLSSAELSFSNEDDRNRGTAGPEGVMSEEEAIREIQHMRKKSRKMLKLDEDKSDMTRAVHSLGASVALVAKKIGAARPADIATNERLQNLERQMLEESMARKHQAEQSNAMLRQIMGSLADMQKK
ncbi:hypothetical protein EDC01DRAFT_632091 [Geopyxis carbonaria]|nr:hypothetical protein EDC01DRAFT_632091 [Geopyxis carbonaria]